MFLSCMNVGEWRPASTRGGYFHYFALSPTCLGWRALSKVR